MKRKNILYAFGAIALCALSTEAYAQNHDRKDSDVDNHIIQYNSKDENISIKAGGRVSLDGAHYINDKTDMSSGVKISEARLNVFASYNNKYDVKIDLDFTGGKVSFRDIYARWNINDRSSLRIGHYVMPFSMERVTSSYDRYFISSNAATNALTLGRRVGISYRAYGDMLWGEWGAHAGDGLKNIGGDDGWGLTTRMVFNPSIGNNMVLHIGGGFSFRTPDANGFEDGDDDYNRFIRYATNVETNIDNTYIANAYVEHAQYEYRYNAEVMLSAPKFFIQSEFTGTTVTRKRDNYKLWQDQLGGMWSFQTVEAWEAWYGKDLRNVSFQGVYVQAGFILRGGEYSYNRFQAINMPSRAAGTLEMVLRFSHTNLNDVDGIWYAGRFYDPAKGPGVDDPNFNYSVGGGKINSYGIGFNYYINKYARLMLNYNYQNISNLTLEDKYSHTIQARLQISF